jgi:hypothetical protein
VTEPGKIIPPVPNLTGDDVKWVRKDAAGNPMNWGHMHKADFDKAVAAGDKIELQAENFSPPVFEADIALQAQYTITGALIATDRYFTTDALDNVSAAEQAQWRAYRQKLRDAAKLTDPAAMVSAIPVPPKGNDPASVLRNKVKPSK